MSIYDVFKGVLTVTRLQTLFWYRHRCPKRHSLKTTTLGSRAVSM